MKKTIAIIMAMFLIMSMLPGVFADNSDNGQPINDNGQEIEEVEEEEIEDEDKGRPELTGKNQDQEHEDGAPKPTGLENAVNKVQRGEIRAHLVQVMEKVQERKRQMLGNLDDVDVTVEDGIVKVKGKKEAKLFGLFRMKHNYKFEIAENGEVKEKGWFKWMWGDIDETIEDTEEEETND